MSRHIGARSDYARLDIYVLSTDQLPTIHQRAPCHKRGLNRMQLWPCTTRYFEIRPCSSATSSFRGLLHGDLNRDALPGFRGFSDKPPFPFRFRERQNQVRTGQVQGANAACLSPAHHNQHGRLLVPFASSGMNKADFALCATQRSLGSRAGASSAF
jgi:hypothetical protein